ncbi:L-histidine N(alpha)-methyltransferase [Actibacterium sp. 188UL27-1]|uniref:L-histidine N(alpha)-methyltransferase n=1 Tax=Actibacterium sp. 188UL27-1 TaxID=2786961 RepID=UPI00195AD04E|nr:L-histidine N(alpha)-methyltransferase [Actibacterium sp. 188UL27-1]MBM7067461.1 L-histidine N(alpha)-methyltransferase [Actibacterium sp. 188UL27-1]
MNKHLRENTELWDSAVDGLGAAPKWLASKWFYDKTGSELFEQITELPEYYPTRTELSILRGATATLAAHMPDDTALVELGSGASVKTKILLDAIPQITTYTPLDISEAFLAETAKGLQTDYPDLQISPVACDFMSDVSFPDALKGRAKVGFFPGSTLGNLNPRNAIDLLQRARNWPDVRSFVLGIDLVKETDRLLRAYDDVQGVTAAFNMNLLARLNSELGADFDLDAFAHEARWNAEDARIEMHLVSQAGQTVTLGQHSFDFASGESIHTENSHKYTPDSIGAIIGKAGWHMAEFLTDDADDFAVCLLTPQ